MVIGYLPAHSIVYHSLSLIAVLCLNVNENRVMELFSLMKGTPDTERRDREGWGMYYSHVNCNRLLISEHLIPGKVSEEHFYKLLAISNIHSEKMARALEAFFVHGLPRREACEKFNVAQGNFSIKQRYLQWLSEAIIGIYPYYGKDAECVR